MMCVLLSFVLSGNFRYLFVFIDFFQTFALIEHCIQFCCTCTMTNILFYFLFTNPAVASFNLPLVLDEILVMFPVIILATYFSLVLVLHGVSTLSFHVQ